MEIAVTYTLYFFIYSFIGWLLEVICKLIEQKKFINRGFLIGPICPIYGYGVLGIVLLIGKDTSDILAIFLKAIFICSLLEYFTSYFMEKLFHARWWDYSKKKFHINGRICLETMVPFGLLGCIVIYFVHPVIVNFVNAIPAWLQLVFASLFMLIYIIDNMVSFRVMNKIKSEIKKQAMDNTETIRKKILEWIDSNSVLYKHIKNAYPKFKIKIVGDRNGKSI